MSLSEQIFCVVDTETCGEMDAAKDAVVEVAAAWARSDGHVGHWLESYINPLREIPAEASGIHHITDRDVVGAPSIDEAQREILRWDEDPGVFVAHNAEFDSARLPLLPGPWLCTKRLAQHLLPDRVNHRNQTLRYVFGGIDIPGVEPGTAHRALADCRVTAFNLAHLIRRYLEAGYPDDVVALLKYAASPIRIKLWPFTADFGKPIADSDWGLITWAIKTDRAKNDPDLLFSLKEESAERARRRNAGR